MSKKAIDVVLLPEVAAADMAIEANGKLVEKFGDEIVLDKNKCLPHISLAMGCMDESDLAQINEVLESIAKSYQPMDLGVTGIGVETNSLGQKVSAFMIGKSQPLQSLHEEVLEKSQPLLTSDVSIEMIYPSGDISETTLQWIKNYRDKAAFENFSPHITLGYGAIEDLQFPKEFRAATLALCHLGNHCTCRDVLVSFELGGS
ncbi:MAG: 2'-5' RNA ligase family protein [Planctomycetes bacterium]|nr:2'-5' RNA ligase family protein [Planctomycetota bacterium]